MKRGTGLTDRPILTVILIYKIMLISNTTQVPISLAFALNKEQSWCRGFAERRE